MYKKCFSVLCGVFALLLMCVSAEAASYPKLNLKMSTTVGDQSNAAVMARAFAERLAEKSGGNIRVRVYPSDQLAGGNMSKGVEMLRIGATDCAFEPVDVLGVLDEHLLALSMPWTFESYEAAEANLNGAGGDYIKKLLADKGIVALGFIHNGFRQLTNSRKTIKTPADLNAMKLRVPGGDVFVNFFRAYGADPIAMSFSELFTALQQKTVDGQENGFDLIVANKFYEVQPYITVWNYSYGSFALVFNKKTYDSFDDATKALLNETAAEVCRIGCQNVVDNDQKQMQLIKDFGCEVTELTEAELNVFKAQLTSYYENMKQKYGAEACEAFGIK